MAVVKNFEELRKGLADGSKPMVSIAAAEDAEVLRAAETVCREGIARAILVGDEGAIRAILEKNQIGLDAEIIHETDPKEAALIAAELVRNKKADILMKGMVNSSDFLHAVLNHERGIRGESLLFHMGAFEIPGTPKLAFHADGGMNPAPGTEEKAQILKTGVEMLHKIGIECPKVAALAANEMVNEKIPATVHAAALQEMNEKGQITGCIVEGPIAMDVALSKEAAAHKKINSRISGDVDFFLVPNIESGNMLGKALMFYVKAKMAGIILGASAPVVMVSRSDNAEAKVNSLALACACARGLNP